MVRTSRSPTDVAAVAPMSSSSSSSSSSSAAAEAPASPSSSASRSSANSSPYEFLVSDNGGGGDADGGLAFVDLDVVIEDAKQSSSSSLLDQHGDFDVEMRDFDFEGDDDQVDGGAAIDGSFMAATSTTAKGSKATTTTKQPKKKKATTAKKNARGNIKQEAASLSTSNSEDSAADAAGSRGQQENTEALSTLELRRKRNRDSMRRARHRQRNEQEKLETMIDQLEDRLEALMRSKENSLAMAASGTNGTEDSSTSYSYSAYSSLLRQTEVLRDQNDQLSEQIRKHAHFQERIGKLADQEKKQLESEIQADEADEDHALLQPLLQWITRATVVELVSYSRDRILEVADLTNTLVPTTHNVLGWEGKRTIHANWAHYTMTKSFLHESAEWLAKRTWDCTVNQDVGEMKRVLSWANGTKVLHRLSDDAVVIARDILVPNLQDIDHPIRIRYILLVFCTPLPNGGFVVGTETLNVYGTSVEDCLEQKVSLAHGMSALTMYAFLFTRIRSPETGADMGCNVTLAGRSGDGSLMYARKVLFEVLPSILRWENTFVAPILRVTD
ncbi:hypothetical protein Gpo141_00006945 [Globisporangium polare]